MTNRYSPSIRRRRLSAELRRLRLAAGMTYEGVVDATKWSRGKISNLESGERKRPQVAEIRMLLDLYKVTDEREREAVLDLCRQSRERGWWTRYTDVFSGEFVGFEAEASSIFNWQPLMVPGLLQVPSYIEALAQAADTGDGSTDVQRQIDARLERQRELGSDQPVFWAIFDEAVLLRLQEHPDVLREQVQHLLEMASAPTITIQMTSSRLLNPASGGSFVIMDFPEVIDPPVVYLETETDGLYLEDAEEVARYRRLADHLRLAAYRPQETIERLRALI